MTYAKLLRCRKCGQEYPLQPLNICDFCFSPLDVGYDYRALAEHITSEKISNGPYTMWRYRDFLPVNSEPVDIGTGFTPLVKASNLGEKLGLNNIYIKNDCLNPTYSFKDRPVAVAVTKAVEFGFDTIACASTGNLAASVAAHAAKAGLKSFVFVPQNTERGKLIGAAVYNPILVNVEGNYDDVNILCSKLSKQYNWGFININLRPYYAEGSKTLGFEIAEQLGWRAPDNLITPAASGLMFTRTWKALEEFAMVQLINSFNTHMFIAQASGAAPIVNSFISGIRHIHPVKPDTIAKSIAIGNPADGYYALMIARQSGGGAISVTDEEILQGIELLAQTEGIFAEATGGVVISTLKKLVNSGLISKDDITVALITGAGPRTQELFDYIVKPIVVKPTIEAFKEAIE